MGKPAKRDTQARGRPSGEGKPNTPLCLIGREHTPCLHSLPWSVLGTILFCVGQDQSGFGGLGAGTKGVRRVTRPEWDHASGGGSAPAS